MHTSDIISLAAVVIAILALAVNYIFPRRTIHLSTQQSIISTVAERIGICNDLWIKNKSIPVISVQPMLYYSVVSEVVMSLEVIELQLVIFGRNYKSVRQDRDHYFALFWKQMNPDLREFLHHTAPEVAKKEKDDYYTDQIDRIHRDLHKSFEKRK
jgi:hypothetical protein